MKRLFLMVIVFSGSLALAGDSGTGSPIKGMSDSGVFEHATESLVEGASHEHKTTFEKGVRHNAFEALCAKSRVNQVQDETTALHEAVKAGIGANVRVLLYWSANPNVVNGSKQTPLHLALLAGREDIVEELKRYGASERFSKKFLPLPKQEMTLAGCSLK